MTSLKYCSCFFFLLLCSLSCDRQSTGLNHIPVKKIKPEKIVDLFNNTTDTIGNDDVCYYTDVQLINDTLLIAQNKVVSEESNHFKIFSTVTHKCLGSFIPKGRGPGEMLSPRIVKGECTDQYLNTIDDRNRLVSIDILGTIDSSRVIVSRIKELCENAFDCMPLSDSLYLTQCCENNEFVFHTVDSNGKYVNDFNPFIGLDPERFATTLSSVMARQCEKEKAAVFMLFFPQFYIMDNSCGEMNSFAVNHDWKKWKSILYSQLNQNTVQYYGGVVSSGKYIIASFWNRPLKQVIEGGAGTLIHIYDWTGTFLFEVRVKGDISNMTFDDKNKILYCVDKSSGRIVYYNLPFLE